LRVQKREERRKKRENGKREERRDKTGREKREERREKTGREKREKNFCLINFIKQLNF
jgi:hypothetical protein